MVGGADIARTLTAVRSPSSAAMCCIIALKLLVFMLPVAEVLRQGFIIQVCEMVFETDK